MFLKFVLLGIGLIIIICLSNMLLTKIKLKYRLYKELKIKEQREKAFRERMKKLEINWISN